MQNIIIENEFWKVSQISEAKKAFATLTGCPEMLIEVYVQGRFRIPNKSAWTNELNLDYGWYKVTKIGNKYLDVYVPSENKTFKAKPWTCPVSKRRPGFRMIADTKFSNLSFRYE